MGDELAERHPDSDDLQRYVDGEIDPARDAELVAHVASCDICHSEVEQMRRVTALLSLSSAPPADLFERIRARRDSGERVLLPPVAPVEEQPGPAAVPTPVDGARPADAARSRHRRQYWRWAAGPLGIAAALLLAVRLAMEESRPTDQPASGPRERLRGVVILPDSSAVGESAAAHSGRVTRADSSRVTGSAEAGSLYSLQETREGLVIRLAAYSQSLEREQAEALDSAASILRQDPERHAIIRYVDPSFNRASDSWHLALRAADRFALGGVDPERVRLVRVQAVNKAKLPSHLDAVEIVIKRP